MSLPAMKIHKINNFKHDFINYKTFESNIENWRNSEPFNHVVFDDFLSDEVLGSLLEEFPDYDSKIWHEYNNPLEVKKTCNNWNSFGITTYKVFDFLNSKNFIDLIEPFVGTTLYPDYGLNGGGLHTHKSGGKLNTHLDYSMHPKLPLQRKLNLIIYLTPNWVESWGGELGLWSNNPNTNKPDMLVKKIIPKFNRAVLFDTSQNSWHGLPDKINMPDGFFRNSFAIYYLCQPGLQTDLRSKALFHPSDDQKNNIAIRKLIAQRANSKLSQSVYINN